MTYRSIKALAGEVADHGCPRLEAFGIDHFESSGDDLQITLSWQLPMDVKVSLVLHPVRHG
jgi:hypothetical protein